MIHRIIILFLSLCAIAVAQPSLTNNNLDNLTPTAKDNLEALGVMTDEAGPDNAAVAAAIAEDPAAGREAMLAAEAPLDMPVPLTIPDGPDATGETHTSPVYIPEGFGGYRYWLAYTPYPGADKENPRVVASNDLKNWVLPAGMSELVDTLAGAHALGHIGWSDTNLHWDGTKLILLYRGYGDGSTYTTAEKIYVRTCTDGVTWSSATAILTSSSSTAAGLLSPSLVQLADNTYRIYVVDNGNGGVRVYSSSTLTSGWTAFPSATVCKFPIDFSAWHLEVRLYGSRYYALVASRRYWALYAYDSSDGLEWYGRGVPFVPQIGTSVDSGGYYRSGFFMTGSVPPVMNVFACAMTGTTADVNNANKTHRAYLYRRAYQGLNEAAMSSDGDVIEMVDHFIRGPGGTASGVLCGDMGWQFYNGVGTGAVYPGGSNDGGSYEAQTPGISCISIKSGATAGNISGITLPYEAANGQFIFRYDMWKRLVRPTISVKFRIERTSDLTWIGIGSSNLSASPARFVGLQFDPGASANWRFVSRESGGSSYNVDSGKAATGGSGAWWHFEMRRMRTKWQMRISAIGAYQDGNDWVDVTEAIADTSGCTISMWSMAGTAAASELRVAKFSLKGFIARN